MTEEADLVCVLTPPGAAAIATIALRGPRVWSVVRDLFQPLSAAPLPDCPTFGRFWPGKFGETARDEVVLAVKRIEPVPSLELQCHGGPEVLRFLQELLISRGIKACTWHEFVAFLGVPAWKVQAQEALVLAPTVRTATILLDQYHGALHKALTEIADGLDGRQTEAALRVERLAKLTWVGRHLVTPFRVGIAGAPNVGKSSLINALAGYTRAIVSPVAGTTRDVVTSRVALDGWPVELFDTAGLCESSENLEREGMQLARDALAQADLVIWVLDGATMPIYAETDWPRMLTVINKIDLPAAWDWTTEPGACLVSALTLAGITSLCERIAGLLAPHTPDPGEATPFTVMTCDGVVAAHRLALADDWDGAAAALQRIV